MGQKVPTGYVGQAVCPETRAVTPKLTVCLHLEAETEEVIQVKWGQARVWLSGVAPAWQVRGTNNHQFDPQDQKNKIK